MRRAVLSVLLAMQSVTSSTLATLVPGFGQAPVVDDARTRAGTSGTLGP
jgi:hypothetical protein